MPIGPAKSSARAPASPSKSTTPTPKAASCCAMRWPMRSSSKPDLIVDFATLTGAARVALGPELPALVQQSRRTGGSGACARPRRAGSAVANAVVAAVHEHARFAHRRSRQCRRVAPCRCDHGGVVSAALRARTRPWIHLDAYAWNDADKPGRPQGGEAQGLRAFFALPRRVTAPLGRVQRAVARAATRRNSPLARRRSLRRARTARLPADRTVQSTDILARSPLCGSTRAASLVSAWIRSTSSARMCAASFRTTSFSILRLRSSARSVFRLRSSACRPSS